jgi:hypothetical protein
VETKQVQCSAQYEQCPIQATWLDIPAQFRDRTCTHQGPLNVELSARPLQCQSQDFKILCFKGVDQCTLLLRVTLGSAKFRMVSQVGWLLGPQQAVVRRVCCRLRANSPLACWPTVQRSSLSRVADPFQGFTGQLNVQLHLIIPIVALAQVWGAWAPSSHSSRVFNKCLSS